VKYEDTFSIIWDSGASICITPNTTFFMGSLESAGALTYLQGVSKSFWIQGKGHVLWTILDIRGQLRTLKIPAYYVPQSRVRLLSTAALLQTYSDKEIRVDVSKLTLSGNVADLLNWVHFMIPYRGSVLQSVKYDV
jgi:hypothetical protein